MPLQPFWEPVAKARHFKRIDSDRAGNGLAGSQGLVIGERTDRKVGDQALNPRLLPGFTRRRSLGCQVGNEVAFGNDPAPGIPACDQKNLQVIALPPPAQRPALQACRVWVSDQPRSVFLM